VRIETRRAAPPIPTRDELDRFIGQLEASWHGTLTVRRQSPADSGMRQIYVSLDGERIAVLCAGEQVTRDIKPGPHRLRVHNTAFWKTIDFVVSAGEHVSFNTINRSGFLTFSVFAFFLGTNLLYLTVEREVQRGAPPPSHVNRPDPAGPGLQP